MAATMVITPAQADIISSLSTDDIPAKLRCAICSKLAVNAFRLPCCEQAICEGCHSTLPSSCPICEHSPLSSDDCTPHKSLRTTVRVFLRTEEKKREASRPKEATPATPIEATATPQLPAPEIPAPDVVGDSTQANQNVSSAVDRNQADTALPSTEGQGDQQTTSGTQPDASANTHDNAPAEDQTTAEETDHPVREKEGAESPGAEKVEESAEADVKNQDGEDQLDQTVSDAGPGFNAMNGAFPNMNFGAAGNMDQMQMMMAMQNGMPAGAFGGFPMMGMAGMGMDPMAMQNMYMNGGFGAQGMGAMSGMMGMGGFGAAGGPNNNWNNGQQQSWNVGQDNFNHPNASGMGNGGDFGSYNSGFQNTGFNQGNYGHANQFNNFRQNQNQYGGGGFRGRGRGRGYGYGYNARGGGYYQNQNGYGGQGNFQEQQNYMGQNYQQGQMTDQSFNSGAEVPEGGTSSDGPSNSAPAVDEFGREIRADADVQGETGEGAEQTDPSKTGQHDGIVSQNPHDDPSTSAPTADGEHVMNANGMYPGINGHAPMGAGPGSNRGFSQPLGSRSGSVQPTLTPAPDVPLNAPKGPKALLRGLPNTSYLTLQARGLVQDDRASRNHNQNYPVDHPNAVVLDPRPRTESPGRERDQSTRRDESHRRHRHDRSRERDGDRDRGYDDKDHEDRDRARSRSPSRSRSRDRRESRRHRRDDRSQSATVRDDGRDEDESRSRRHRHRHADDVDSAVRSKDGEQVDERSVSPDDTKRSSHHRSSRRDRDGEKRSSRDKDYDRERERDRDRKHRSHRDRDYDRRDKEKERDRHRDRDGDKDKDRDRKERRRDRDRDRDRERDREHRHRSSKRTSVEPAAEEAFDPPSGPRGGPENGGGGGSSNRGLEIKGCSNPAQEAERRRSSVVTATAEKDPYAAEREAANRERLRKEARQMAERVKKHIEDSGTKRRRGDDVADSSERRSSHRRKGRRGEVVSVDEEEERMRRLEAERESARFRDD